MKSGFGTKKISLNQPVRPKEDKDSQIVRNHLEELRNLFFKLLTATPAQKITDSQEEKSHPSLEEISTLITELERVEHALANFIQNRPALKLNQFDEFLPFLGYLGAKSIIKLIHTRNPLNFLNLVKTAAYGTRDHEYPLRILEDKNESASKKLLLNHLYPSFNSTDIITKSFVRHAALDSILKARRTKLHDYLVVLITDELFANNLTESEILHSLILMAENYAVELLKIICTTITKSNFPHAQTFQVLQQGLMLSARTRITSNLQLILYLYKEIGGNLNICLQHPAIYTDPITHETKKVTVSIHLLMFAIMAGSYDIYKLIADQIGDINNVPGVNILNSSANAYNNHDIDPLLFDDNNMQAIHFAVQIDEVNILRDLLSRKEILINAQTVFGLSPLMIAAKFQNLSAVTLLCANGANPLLTGRLPDAQNTARKLSTFAYKSMQLVQHTKPSLLTSEAKTRHKDYEKIQEVLHRAEVVANIELAKLSAKESKSEPETSLQVDENSSLDASNSEHILLYANNYLEVLKARYRVLITDPERFLQETSGEDDIKLHDLIDLVKQFKKVHGKDSLPNGLTEVLRAAYPYLGYFGIGYDSIEKLLEIYPNDYVGLATITAYAVDSHNCELSDRSLLSQALFRQLEPTDNTNQHINVDPYFASRRTALRSNLMTRLTYKSIEQNISVNDIRKIYRVIAENLDVDFFSQMMHGMPNAHNTKYKKAYIAEATENMLFYYLTEKTAYKKAGTKVEKSSDAIPAIVLGNNASRVPDDSILTDVTLIGEVELKIPAPGETSTIEFELTASSKPRVKYNLKSLQRLLDVVGKSLQVTYNDIQSSSKHFEAYPKNIGEFERNFDDLFTPVNNALRKKIRDIDPNDFSLDANTSSRMGYLGLTHLIKQFIAIENKFQSPFLLDYVSCMHIFSSATPVHYSKAEFLLDKNLDKLKSSFYNQFPRIDVDMHSDLDHSLRARREEIRGLILPFIFKNLDQGIRTKDFILSLTMIAVNHDSELFEHILDWLDTRTQDEKLQRSKIALRDELRSLLMRSFAAAKDLEYSPIKLDIGNLAIEIDANVFIHLVKLSRINLLFYTSVLMCSSDDVNRAVEASLTPLHVVAITGQKMAFDVVCNKFTDFNPVATIIGDVDELAPNIKVKMRHICMIDDLVRPLHFALAYGHPVLAEKLIAHQANITLQTKTNITSLQIAESTLKSKPPLEKDMPAWNKVMARLHGKSLGDFIESQPMTYAERISNYLSKNKIFMKDKKLDKLVNYLEETEAKYEKGHFSLNIEDILGQVHQEKLTEKIKLKFIRLTMEQIVELGRRNNNLAKSVFEHMLAAFRITLPAPEENEPNESKENTDISLNVKDNSEEQTNTPEEKLPSDEEDTNSSSANSSETNQTPDSEMRNMLTPSPLNSEPEISQMAPKNSSMLKPLSSQRTKKEKLSRVFKNPRNKTSQPVLPLLAPNSTQVESLPPTSPSTSAQVLKELAKPSLLEQKKAEEEKLKALESEKLNAANKELYLENKKKEEEARLEEVKTQLQLKKLLKQKEQEDAIRRENELKAAEALRKAEAERLKAEALAAQRAAEVEMLLIQKAEEDKEVISEIISEVIDKINQLATAEEMVSSAPQAAVESESKVESKIEDTPVQKIDELDACEAFAEQVVVTALQEVVPEVEFKSQPPQTYQEWRKTINFNNELQHVYDPRIWDLMTGNVSFAPNRFFNSKPGSAAYKSTYGQGADSTGNSKNRRNM